jgi:hypothetical protein
MRRHTPSRVLVVSAEGTAQRIALRTRKGRWEHASALCVRLVLQLGDGARVEMRTAGDELCATWTPADASLSNLDLPAGDVVEMQATLEAREAQLLSLLVSAQDHAVDRHLEGTKAMQDAFQQVLLTVTSRMAGLEVQVGNLLNNIVRLTDQMVTERAQFIEGKADAEGDALAEKLIAKIAPDFAAFVTKPKANGSDSAPAAKPAADAKAATEGKPAT